MYDHPGCTEYCKDFTVALKMIDVIDKKQMYDIVVTGKENVSKNYNCIISMLLINFNVYFMFDCAYLMSISLKTAIVSGCLWDQVWLFLVKTGWKPCIAVAESQLSSICCKWT